MVIEMFIYFILLFSFSFYFIFHLLCARVCEIRVADKSIPTCHGLKSQCACGAESLVGRTDIAQILMQVNIKSQIRSLKENTKYFEKTQKGSVLNC